MTNENLLEKIRAYRKDHEFWFSADSDKSSTSDLARRIHAEEDAKILAGTFDQCDRITKAMLEELGIDLNAA